jgi:hypothetical protein
MPNCYEFCFGIAKHIYNLFIFLSCRTPPLIEEETKHHECYKNGVKYCKMCDLDDFVMEESQSSQPLEKVEPNFCTTFQKSGKVEPKFDFAFSPPFPPFYSPFFNKNAVHH